MPVPPAVTDCISPTRWALARTPNIGCRAAAQTCATLSGGSGGVVHRRLEPRAASREPSRDPGRPPVHDVPRAQRCTNARPHLARGAPCRVPARGPRSPCRWEAAPSPRAMAQASLLRRIGLTGDERAGATVRVTMACRGACAGAKRVCRPGVQAGCAGATGANARRIARAVRSTHAGTAPGRRARLGPAGRAWLATQGTAHSAVV